MKIQRDSNCEKCGLWETCNIPYMSGHGPLNPTILVVGEAPGAEEDKEGVPFVGRAGKLLRAALEEFFDMTDVRFTNTVRCRPPQNKITKRAINHCLPNLLREIEECDPELVLLLGNSPLNAVLGESGITNWNGVVIDRGGRLYVPLFHPAYLLRDMSVQDDWYEGMFNAEEALRHGHKEQDEGYEYIYPTTLDEVKDMADWLSGSEWISFDTETASLDAYADHNVIIAISFAEAEIAYAVPMSHPGTPWSDKELDEVLEIVCDILEEHSGRIIGHNIKFDQIQMMAYADFWFVPGGDTMLVSHLLDSRKGIHGLKRLAGLHLGMYNYDAALGTYCADHPEANVYTGGTYAAVPLDVLLPYAAMDASATYMLHDKLYPKLSDKQKILYHQLVMPVSNTLARVENNGILVDRFVADRYRKIYHIRQAEIYDEIMEHPMVRQLVEETQEDLDDEHRTRQAESSRTLKRKVYVFNPNSSDQLRRLYFDYCDIPVLGETKTGRPTTSAKVYKPVEHKYPILKLVRYYKLLTKMVGTYLAPAADGKWESGDGRVRCNFNLHGTRTGRLSSSKPNMQNIPTPEKEPDTLLADLPIKNIFTHTFPKGVLMSVDYAGMELRVFASLAVCNPMLDIHRSGLDFHSVVSFMARDGMAIKDVTREMIERFRKYEAHVRYRYKWTNWTLLYGGDEYTLHRMYDMSLEDAEATVEAYYDAFPEVLEYREECVAFAKEHGYIESPFGRREHLPYIKDSRGGKASKARRAAVNMPVQSGASDVLLLALIIIDETLQKEGLKTMVVNTVHDSIVLDVPQDEISKVASICVSVMENIVEMVKFYMPSIDLSWLKSPLKADVEIGTHYGAEEKYGG